MNKDFHDLIQVGVVNITAVGISISDIETGLRILSLVLACSYTAYKFFRALNQK
jgi:EamA domain-containing membrane protein RarD